MRLPLRTGRAIRGWLIATVAVGLLGCQSDTDWNLVLVTFDTTRADHIGAYGAERAQTPNLDALAAEGTLFARAYTSIPITSPSHATILTGKYPLGHGVRDNGLFVLDEGQQTLAEMLRDHGFRTAAAVGSFPLSAQFGLNQGFEIYDDHFASKFGFANQDSRPSVFFEERPAEFVNESIDDWLASVAGERFFLWIHYYDPHQPFQAPPPYDQLFLDDPYAGEIAYADESFGRLMSRLGELGVDDRTLVVFTSDHGEGLGDHNEDTHSYLLYDSTLHVPLIMRAPASPGGRVVAPPVGTVDIVPTVLDLLGLPTTEDLHGRSLATSVRGDDDPEPVSLYAETLSPRLSHGWGELRALVDENHKYVHGPRPELYDLEEDPGEIRNRVADEPELADRMRRELARLIDARAAGEVQEASAPDDETRRRLMALGYLSGGAGEDTRIVERLIADGVAPQDRIQEVNRVSRAKNLLVEGHALRAEEIFRDLLSESPDSVMYTEMLANSLLRLGRLEEVKEHLERLQGGGAGGSDQLWSQLAFAYFVRGEVDAALEVTALASEYYPSAPVWFVRASALRQSGDGDGAEAALHNALELDPEHAPARVDLALRHIQNGDLDQGAAELDTALRAAPYYPRAHFNLARLLLDKADYEGAENHFARAVRLDPNYLQAHHALVVVRSGLGDTAGAREALAALESVAPESDEARRARETLEGG